MKKTVRSVLLLMVLFPAAVFCQGTVKVRVYNNGNTSVKINDSKDTLTMAETQAWLQNSGLAFSENGEELYFRHPTDHYYQVWNVGSKQKTAEIPFSEAGNTPKGRTVIASFPNITYAKDEYINQRIWLSEDLQVSFDKKDNLTLYKQNIAEKPFNLYMRWHVDFYNFIDYDKFRKKVDLSNIKYQFYFHKQSNKLFIAVAADQVTKDKSNYPFCGVYYFDLNTNTVTSLSENMKCQCVSGNSYKYRWYFSGNYLFNYFVVHPDMSFRQFDLNTVSPKDLLYSMITPAQVFSDKNPNGWDFQHIGTDQAGNAYLANPLNNHILVNKFDMADKSKVEAAATILHSANRKNYVHPANDDDIWNVMAISPSGKQFAYINLYHRSDVGNYASIMLYNMDEKDRVYTLNDQTKYEPYITKNYITNQESEDLALSWKNQGETDKNKRKALYQTKIDSLKTKIAEVKNALTAIYQRDLDLAKQGKYGELLTGKKWVGYKTYLSTITYAGTDGGPSRTITAEFGIQEEMVFTFTGQNLQLKTEETLKLPRGKTNDYGELVLKDKDVSDNSYGMNGYGPVRYVVSKCETQVTALKKPEFTLGSTPYIACYDGTKGEEAVKDSRHYKKFTDEFMFFLWRCTFNIYSNSNDKKITILATGKNGVTIGFDYELTPIQRELDDKLNDLQKQVNDLENYIQTGK
ncbi:MAG: hypothetical protein IPO42_00920 [Chitinophagaceae bacterium]|nr:hypothetical protein [Chitinophagaceae bacterium]